jgi:membrane fusion protein (multidrug efflux system)
MIKRLFLLLLIITLIFGGLFGWKYQQIRQATLERTLPPPPVVAVTTVRQMQWQPYLSAVGSLIAVAGIDVSNEVAGKITAIHFKSGEPATQGQLLIELDTAADKPELDGLLASQRLAQLNFNRLSKLLGSKSISISRYDETMALLDEAKAAVIAKRALIDKKKIHAPFTGILGIRKVDIGQYLPEGSAMVPLQSLDPIHMDFSVPERRLSDLKPGQTVELEVQAYPEERFTGKITAFDPGVDKGTRTLKVRATMDNPSHRLRPGMFAGIRVLLSRPRTVLTLLDTAITYNPYGSSVFLVLPGEGGNVVQRRQILTGETRQGRVEITQGLEAGDRVVSAGQVKLRNGISVILDEKPAPGERRVSQ